MRRNAEIVHRVAGIVVRNLEGSIQGCQHGAATVYNTIFRVHTTMALLFASSLPFLHVSISVKLKPVVTVGPAVAKDNSEDNSSM